jgi:hypothetical protein
MRAIRILACVGLVAATPALGSSSSSTPSFEYVPETSLAEQITLSIPSDWAIHDQTRLLTGRSAPHGSVVYSPIALQFSGAAGTRQAAETAARLDTGELPSLFLDRIPAPRGAKCEAMTKAAQRRIGEIVAGEDPMFGPGATVLVPPRAEATSVGGVPGARVVGRARDAASGREWALDLVAIGDGTTLYLLYVRAAAEHFAKAQGVLEAVLPTVRLTRCSGR